MKQSVSLNINPALFLALKAVAGWGPDLSQLNLNWCAVLKAGRSLRFDDIHHILLKYPRVFTWKNLL